MTPPPTPEMVKTVVAYLAGTIKANKAVKDFFGDFTTAAVKWLRPIFLIDDKEETPEKIIANLQKEEPGETLYTEAVEIAVRTAVKEDPKLEENLKTLFEEVQAKGSKLTLKDLNSKEGGVKTTIDQENSSADIQNLEAAKDIVIDIKQK